MQPTVDGDRRTYASGRRQLLIAASLVALFLAGSSLIFERDPDTGLKPLPSDYVWVVIPGAILIAVLAWRARKTRVVTDKRKVDIIRVVGHETIPWRTLRRFEVHPTPGRQGSVVVARLEDERIVKVWTEIMIRPVRDRPAAKATARARAAAIADALEADRVERARARSAPSRAASG